MLFDFRFQFLIRTNAEVKTTNMFLGSKQSGLMFKIFDALHWIGWCVVCVCLSVFVCCGVYSYILILNVGAGRRTGFMLIFSIVVFVFFDELASSSNCLEFVVMHLSSFLEFQSFLCGRKEETKILGIDRELHLWWTYVSVPRFRVRHPHLPTPWMFL